MSVVRLRKLIAFDRLLARLLATAPDRWMLKGGLALNLRFADRARTTMDMDLVRQDDREASREEVLNAIAIDLGDYFSFRLRMADGNVNPADANLDRYLIISELGGRRFEELHVDVGFVPALPAWSESVPGIGLLEFADFTRLTVPVLPVVNQIAEKLHAYTFTYPDSRQNTRVKDLVDLLLMSSECSMPARDLYDALNETFSVRDTHELPMFFPTPPKSWAPAYRTIAREMRFDNELHRGHASVAAFLDPILDYSVRRSSKWRPDLRQWIGQ